MSKFKIEIKTHDMDNSQSRLIIEVNGIEIDILADNDGVCITAQHSRGNAAPILETGFDFETRVQ